MRRVTAHAKINLALVVGPPRADGKHEVATVLQQISLADTLTLSGGEQLSVSGFAGDTIVTEALQALAALAGVEPRWDVEIEKAIPVAAGLGGGSSDAAAALRLANDVLPTPLPLSGLCELAATIGADVPFFLQGGAQLGTGDGTKLAPMDVPTDYRVVLVLPADAVKTSTGDVYRAFDARDGADGFPKRRAALFDALGAVREARDLGPPAERPCLVAGVRAATRGRRVPRRRERRRSLRLRPLRRTSASRGSGSGAADGGSDVGRHTRARRRHDWVVVSTVRV